MTVSDRMTPDPITVAPSAGLIEIRSLFRQHRFRHVPVVEAGRLVGVVSDRDVLATVSPFLDTPSERARDVDTLAATAGDLMAPAPSAVAPDEPLANATRRMVDEGVSSVLVVDGPELVGILTALDLLRASLAA